jgi:hypothetical protein
MLFPKNINDRSVIPMNQAITEETKGGNTREKDLLSMAFLSLGHEFTRKNCGTETAGYRSGNHEM